MMPSPINVWIEQIRPYFDAGYALFPLVNPLSEKDPQRAKRPRDIGYKEKPYPFDENIAAIEAGCNLGHIVPSGHLVIDCDPRGYKKGTNSYDALCELTGIDLINTYPSVITGSGGYHIYASVDPAARLKKKSKNSPGSIGCTVVSPMC